MTSARVSRGIIFSVVLMVCAVVPSVAAQAKKKPPAAPIDLNSATLEQLQELPGIGPRTANAIVKFRDKSGPFKRPEDLLAIHGISRAKFENLRPYIVVKPAATSTH